MRPLRRTRRDLLAAGVLTGLAVVAVAGSALTAETHRTTLRTAGDTGVHAAPLDPPAVAPDRLEPAFTAPAPAGSATPPRPQIAGGVILSSPEPTVLEGLDAAGRTVWRHDGVEPLCGALAGPGDAATLVRRKGRMGCGDVVRLRASDGHRKATRSAWASTRGVHLMPGGDRIGLVSPERVELWREDLVRTVEYGGVPFKQEPDLQPHENCSLTGALAADDTLAVTETCPEGDGERDWLRLMTAVPEDSREPEVSAAVALRPGSRLVAAAPGKAAVWLPARPGEEPEIRSYDENGDLLADDDGGAAPILADPDRTLVPATTPLDDGLATWFDGASLRILDADGTRPVRALPDALGSGALVAGRVLYPVPAGVAVADPATGEVDRVLPLDRGGFEGPVDLAVDGGLLVERRGDELAAFRMIAGSPGHAPGDAPTPRPR